MHQLSQLGEGRRVQKRKKDSAAARRYRQGRSPDHVQLGHPLLLVLF
jgi:hypothetical protein